MATTAPSPTFPQYMEQIRAAIDPIVGRKGNHEALYVGLTNNKPIFVVCGDGVTRLREGDTGSGGYAMLRWLLQNFLDQDQSDTDLWAEIGRLNALLPPDKRRVARYPSDAFDGMPAVQAALAEPYKGD